MTAKFSQCPVCKADLALHRAIVRLGARLRRMPNGCLEWQGRRVKGYGVIRIDRDRTTQTHRLAWIAKHGPIPEGLWVLHKCDNPACCDTDHHFLGTRQDNNDDKMSKGRQAKGDRIWKNRKSARGTQHGRAKLTEDDVIAIRADTQRTQEALAKAFGVSSSLVRQIRKGEVWMHLLH